MLAIVPPDTMLPQVPPPLSIPNRFSAIHSMQSLSNSQVAFDTSSTMLFEFCSATIKLARAEGANGLG